jgi:hypothetical protein
MRLFTRLVLLMIVTSCADKHVILVKIDVDSLTIDNRVIDKSDFEQKIGVTIDSLVNSGLDRSMIMINVTASKEISQHEMSEIEKAIRRQRVTRDYTWTD